jgi:agmatine deiminase
MNKYLLISILFIFSNNILFSQDLPKGMTEEEKILWQTYQPPVSIESSNPPPGPVRTMAEWEEQQGIVVTWQTTNYYPILRQTITAAQQEGLVFIICADSNSVKSNLTSNSVSLHNVRFLQTPSNSIWVRDYGPWTVYSSVTDTHRIIDWVYNRPRPADDVTPVFVANYLGLPIHQTTVEPNRFIATGGNFMVDGHGTGFSSKLVLNENPGKTESEINLIMNKYMGIDRYIKMENLPYDGIHHIDMHMKLLDEETLMVGEYPPGVADGPYIEANLQYVLNNFLSCFDRPFKVVRVVMPPDQFNRYPPTGYYRTFTNSTIINKTVVVPTYELQYDTTALRIYREAMPGYNVVGINCNTIIPASGAIHCITKEVGVDEPVFISHPKMKPLIFTAGPYEVKAFIKSKTGIANASVYFTTDTSAGFQQVPMTMTAQDTFAAFVNVPPGQTGYYYISASSNSGRTIAKPIVGALGPYHFKVDESVPVELTGFYSFNKGHYISLTWITASELNNKGFEIQRSSSASSAREWETLAFVPGRGTTTEFSYYNYDDNTVTAGKYSYRLKQIDYNGTFSYSDEVFAEIYPFEFALYQNYPNPFNPSTVIKYEIGSRQFVSLKIYDLLGNEISTLVNETKDPGVYEVRFDASYNKLSSGIYMYKLTSGAFSATKKLIFVK